MKGILTYAVPVTNVILKSITKTIDATIVSVGTHSMDYYELGTQSVTRLLVNYSHPAKIKVANGERSSIPDSSQFLHVSHLNYYHYKVKVLTNSF